MKEILLSDICACNDFYMYAFVCCFFCCRNPKDAIGVNIESQFYLCYTFGRRSNPTEGDTGDGFIIVGHGALTLQNTQLHLGLVVDSGTKHLTSLGRDGSIGINEFCHNTSLSLDAET